MSHFPAHPIKSSTFPSKSLGLLYVGDFRDANSEFAYFSGSENSFCKDEKKCLLQFNRKTNLKEYEILANFAIN